MEVTASGNVRNTKTWSRRRRWMLYESWRSVSIVSVKVTRDRNAHQRIDVFILVAEKSITLHSMNTTRRRRREIEGEEGRKMTKKRKMRTTKTMLKMKLSWMVWTSLLRCLQLKSKWRRLDLLLKLLMKLVLWQEWISAQLKLHAKQSSSSSLLSPFILMESALTRSHFLMMEAKVHSWGENSSIRWVSQEDQSSFLKQLSKMIHNQSQLMSFRWSCHTEMEATDSI